MKWDAPLRRTTKRKRIIDEIGIICKRNNIPIVVDLNYIHYNALAWAKIKLLCEVKGRIEEVGHADRLLE